LVDDRAEAFEDVSDKIRVTGFVFERDKEELFAVISLNSHVIYGVVSEGQK